MNILLIGSTGQIGWELQKALENNNNLILSNNLGEISIDMSKPSEIKKSLQFIKPDLLVNAAAYTDVDNAENEIDLAYAINSEAPKALAEEALRLDIPIIHYSSDYVFDGLQNSLKLEKDETNPLSIYGKTKLEGEKNIINSGCKYIILRTSWVFSSRRKNFLKTILKLSKEKEKLSIINDQLGTPTSAELIAKTTSHIIEYLKEDSKYYGLYNCVASGYTSWFDYANFIIEFSSKINSESKIELLPINTASYKTLASRPLDSRLCVNKIEEVFDLEMPHWKRGVEKVMLELEMN